MEQTRILNKRLNLDEKIYKANKIISLLNDYFNVDCMIPIRKSNILTTRHIAIYFIHKYIPISTIEIGKLFNSKSNKFLDHATILHAKNKIADLIPIDKEIKGYVEDLEKDAKNIALLSYEELVRFKIKEEILLKIKNYNVLGLSRLNNEILIMPV